MAVIKCKMCGGDLHIEEDSTVCECEYCGTRQTVPSADNEKKLTLFNRAGRLLRACEFDKAAGVFETIVADFPEEAEAYWGLVLCKYGIEYVDDPATGRKIPTCHRSSFESVLDDPNFEQACENTDAIARRVYRDEARAVEDLRQAILSVSGREEPYDVFISYKETDENGERTLDSVIAQDIYKELTSEGYRVFFSRISLESKLGTEYEPYIFAALNSAKVMIVVGTDYENFDSVWVKNEWSRFLKLIAAGQKKTLIPVFKNMDAYDMPKEFNKLAALDIGKVGAMQDLLHGVEKLIPLKKTEMNEAEKDTAKETAVRQAGGPNIVALLKRGKMALEDGDWDKAIGFFDQALSMDAECADAYLGLVLAGAKAHNRTEYMNAYIEEKEIRGDNNVKRILEFGNGDILSWFNALFNTAKDEDEKKRLQKEKQEAERRAEKEKQEAERRAEKEKQEAERKANEEKERRLREKQDAERQAEEAERRKANEERLKPIRERIAAAKDLVAIVGDDIVAIMPDGSVKIARYGENEVVGLPNWHDMKQIAQGYGFIGVKDDGGVIVEQRNDDYTQGMAKQGMFDVSNWKNMRKIITTGCGGQAIGRTIGLTNDGRVLATASKGTNYSINKKLMAYDFSGWSDIIDISGNGEFVLGLRSDGSVICTDINERSYLNNYLARLKILHSWANIVAIDTSSEFAAGLKSDGTVIVAGNVSGVNTDNWNDIVSIAAGYDFLLGLKADGTVISSSKNRVWDNYIKNWKNIVALSVYNRKAVGITENGDVKCVAWDYSVRETVPFEHKLFSSVSSIKQEQYTARMEAAERRGRRVALSKEKDQLKNEYYNLGLFSNQRRKEIKARLSEIEKEMQQL